MGSDFSSFALTKLDVLSGLHTEFADFDPPETDADIVELAGGIGVGTGGIEWAARQFTDKPVISVPRNHEYYHRDVGIMDDLKSGAPANRHVLLDEVSGIAGGCFLGTTLWSDFRLYGEGGAWFSRQQARALIEDLVSIRNGKRQFTPED